MGITPIPSNVYVEFHLKLYFKEHRWVWVDMSQPLSTIKDITEVYWAQVSNGEIKPYPSKEGTNFET